MENWQAAGFGIYVHWPFCAAKCPYCDFNSHVSNQIDQARWLRAYLMEIDTWAERTPGRRVSSVFFGGGTPSLMDPSVIAGILERIRHHWVLANDVEITLEANPTSVEAGRFRGFVDAGVNRFSIGLQALDDSHLKALGRLHTVAEGRAAYDIARTVCDRVSFDLIYARQNQSLAEWEMELAKALALGSDHLSLYQLTIESGTAFGDRVAAGKLRGLPSEDMSADMYSLTQDMTGAAGMIRYEVSNHGHPGQVSRHNLIYWRGGDWLGIGPGAHGRVEMRGRRTATETASQPGAWLARVEADGHAAKVDEPLEDIDIAEEYMMMSMRLVEGMDMQRLASLGYQLEPERVLRLGELGMITADPDAIRTTETGVLLLNQILPNLLPLKALGQE
ncbi:MAG: radical SAM family heme chaperone HemW [Jannaschia sp.]